MFPESGLGFDFLVNQPIYLRGRRIVGPLVNSYWPATFVHMESRFSKYFLLLPLAAFLGIEWAIGIMLVYGMGYTLFYEWLSSRGRIPEPMETNNPAKGFMVGLQQWGYSKVVKRLGPGSSNLVKIPTIAFGALTCGGVVAVHYYIKAAGYSGIGAVVGNMACRLAAIPEKFLYLSGLSIAIGLVKPQALQILSEIFR